MRTVVFRGFLPQKYIIDDMARTTETCCLCFITDDRSAKFSHLGSGKTQGVPIECCWWLDEAGVQFRIAGRTLVATAQSEEAVLRSAATDVWERLGDSTKRQMYWPHPGAPKGQGAESVKDDNQISLEGSHFVLLIVVPDSVDELHLGGGQKRILYSRTEGSPAGCEVEHTATSAMLASLRNTEWSHMAVNP